MKNISSVHEGTKLKKNKQKQTQSIDDCYIWYQVQSKYLLSIDVPSFSAKKSFYKHMHTSNLEISKVAKYLSFSKTIYSLFSGDLK